MGNRFATEERERKLQRSEGIIIMKTNYRYEWAADRKLNKLLRTKLALQ